MSLSRIVTRIVPDVNDPHATDGMVNPDGIRTALVIGKDTNPARGECVHWPTFDRYEIRGELGRGGMGVVYKAYDGDLKRNVAIKMILGGSLAALDARTRFRSETEAIGRLNHPNLVRIYETGSLNGHPYAVMEYIEGGTLADHIAYRTFGADEAARIIADLAEGIDSAHQCGVLHRDLKPANVLLNGHQPKIVDFGLAKLEGAADCTQTGDVIGTPNYMAPERVTGPKTAIGVGVDIYALGAILYELLTRHIPFEGSSPVEVLRLVVDQNMPSVRTLRPDVSRDLDTICQKCLQKNPLRRYATAKELADDLRRYLRREPIQARPISMLERVWRWSRRNPTIAVSLVLVGVLLTGLAVASMYTAQRFRLIANDREEALNQANASAAIASWRLYRANMAAVSSNLQLNNLDTANDALQLAPKEHRGWEWHYFAAQMDLAEHTLGPRREFTHDVVFTPDHRYGIHITDEGIFQTDLATLAIEQIIPTAEPRAVLYTGIVPDRSRLFLPQLGGRLLEYEFASRRLEEVTLPIPPESGQLNRIFTPYFSDDSRYVALVCNEDPFGPLVILLPPDRSLACVIPVRGNLRAVFIRPEQDLLLMVCEHQLYFWSMSQATMVGQIEVNTHVIRRANLSDDGRRLATSGAYPHHAIDLWDVPERRLLATLGGHSNTVARMAFSHHHQLLLSGSLDGNANIWNAQTGQLLRELRGHTQCINCVAFLPDDRSVVTCSEDGTLRIWDVASGQGLAILRGHRASVCQFRLNDDGSKLASVGMDRTVNYWDLNGILRRNQLGRHDKFVYGLAMHPKEARVASCAWDGTVCEWDIETGRLLNRLQHQYAVVSSATYHSSGERLLTVSRHDRDHLGHLTEWNLQTRQKEREQIIRGGFWMQETNPAYRPDHTSILVGGNRHEVMLWPADHQLPAIRYCIADSSKEFTDPGPVAWHPDGQHFVTGAANGLLARWQLGTTTAEREWQGHERVVTFVGYSPDGRWLISASEDRKVRLWDAQTLDPVATLAHGSAVYHAAFHPTEKRLVTACADNSIRVWDTSRFEEVAELRGHSKYVHAVAFTPTGERLLSASGDGTIRVWDTRPMARFNPNANNGPSR